MQAKQAIQVAEILTALREQDEEDRAFNEYFLAQEAKKRSISRAYARWHKQNMREAFGAQEPMSLSSIREA